MPVCSCCPNFISPGVERCENCATPAGRLMKCPTCRSEVLEGIDHCRHCGYYISPDGQEGSEYPFPDVDPYAYESEFDDDGEAELEEDLELETYNDSF